MKLIKIKKLYKGSIDIQSTILNDCFTKNESIKITINDQPGYMLLKPEEFKSKHTGISKKEYKSKFRDNKTYRLVSFKWEPIINTFQL